MTKHLRAFCTVLLLFSAASAPAEDAKAPAKKEAAKKIEIIKAHAFAARGEPLYKEGFKHFNYVNPNAPKGGDIVVSAIGTYDSFNRYAPRGDADSGSENFYDTLMIDNDDEVSVYYPLIAESLEYPSDYTWVAFIINPKARHADGKPITAEDVVFSFNKFKEQGVSQFRSYYKDVISVEAPSSHKAVFKFKESNKDYVGALAGLTILPKHYWLDKDLSEPLSEPPVGSGAYVVTDYKMGQSATYKRLDDYWARDLPSRKGLLNFNSIRYDYYRDQTVALEAFKTGAYDIRVEANIKHWMQDYDIPAVKKGLINKEEIAHDMPQPMHAFVFNIQHELFQDRRVRQAMNYLFDFEWLNKSIYYGAYKRNTSYFENTPYAATGKPEGKELEILKAFKGKIPDEVFGEVWRPNVTDGSGNIRKEMRKALALLKQAGWQLKDQKLVHKKTGKPFEFEVLMYRPRMEKVALPFKRNLERVGITMNLRMVDTSQYLKRMRDRDFDATFQGYSAMPYPDPSMKIAFHSEFIDSSYNQAGVKDPVIDALVEGIAANQEDDDILMAYGHAFDRVALWNFYLIPQWHSNVFRVASWNKFSRPSVSPKYAVGISSWWYDEEKSKKLKKAR